MLAYSVTIPTAYLWYGAYVVGAIVVPYCTLKFGGRKVGKVLRNRRERREAREAEYTSELAAETLAKKKEVKANQDKYLPGVWLDLFKQMDATTCSLALSLAKRFCENSAVKKPPLPCKGAEMICSLMGEPSYYNNDLRLARIADLSEALAPWVVASTFNVPSFPEDNLIGKNEEVMPSREALQDIPSKGSFAGYTIDELKEGIAEAKRKNW